MKLQLFTHSRKAMALATWGTILTAGLFSGSARADEWDKKTVLTVNQPIQIRDTYLEPGQYVLRLLNSQSDRHVVQIFNGDESRIINTILATPTYRMEPKRPYSVHFLGNTSRNGQSDACMVLSRR